MWNQNKSSFWTAIYQIHTSDTQMVTPLPSQFLVAYSAQTIELRYCLFVQLQSTCWRVGKHGKYRHLHWLSINPSSPQLSWSRPDDPRPALLPCQADSSVFSIPPVGACSCGTDRKRKSRQTCKTRQSGSADTESCHLQRGKDISPLSVQWRLEERQRWISGTPWPNLETGVGPADHYLPPAHRALWSECPSEEDWHFRHFPLWVRTSWPNPRPRPSVLPKICRETSSNMARGCWSGDQAVGLGRRPLPDGWFCGINRTEDLTCTAVDRWRRRRIRSMLVHKDGMSQTQTSHPKMVNPRDIAGERRRPMLLFPRNSAAHIKSSSSWM